MIDQIEKIELMKIVEGLEKAYSKLVVYKKEKKSPLVISDNGKVIKIPHNKIELTTKYLL